MLAVNVSAVVLNSTTISVQWNILRACNVSGKFVTYRVRYAAVSTGREHSVEQTFRQNLTNLETLVVGLTPYTNYCIAIAAVNDQGELGPFSLHLEKQTLEDGKVHSFFPYGLHSSSLT